MSHWRSSGGINRGRRSGGRWIWKTGGLAWLLVKEDRLCSGVSFSLLLLLLLFANSLLREGRQVCKACVLAKQHCTMSEGDTIKVSQKKTEDVEKGSSSGKKQKRKEDEEIEAEFGLVVEEL